MCCASESLKKNISDCFRGYVEQAEKIEALEAQNAKLRDRLTYLASITAGQSPLYSYHTARQMVEHIHDKATEILAETDKV